MTFTLNQNIKYNGVGIMAIAALILIIFKILFELTIYIIKMLNQKEKTLNDSEGKVCQYLQKKEDKNICTNILCKRNIKIGICPRHKCWGFSIGQTKIDDDIEILNSPYFLSLKKIIDFFPEIAAALLAINEIF